MVNGIMNYRISILLAAPLALFLIFIPFILSAQAEPLTASLDPSSPASQFISVGSVGNETARIRLTAGSEDISVTSLWVGGNGWSSDVSSIYLFEGDRLFESNEGSGLLYSFTLSSPIKIPANTYKLISIKANISSKAVVGHTLSLGLSSASGTTASNKQASVNYSVSGNTMTIASAESPGLLFAVSTDKLTYTSDEKIQIYITAINETINEKVLNFNTGCQVSYDVEFFDFGNSMLCTKELTSVTMLPLSKVTWTLVHSPELHRLKEGSYKLTGKVIGYGSATTSITIKSSTSNLSIVTTSLPTGKLNSEYTASIVATGGTGSYRWSVDGTLPPGLKLIQGLCFQAACQIPVELAGIPTETGYYKFLITVADDISKDTKLFAIQVDKVEAQAYFRFTDGSAREGNTFIFELNDSNRIAEARDILAGKIKDRTHVMGTIIKTPAPYNTGWGFYLDPSSVVFFENAVEVCDASIGYVEEHLKEVGGSFLPNNRWCPWLSALMEEVKIPIVLPEKPQLPEKPSVPEKPNLENERPIGYFDKVSASEGIIYGWALDPDHPEKSITVHIYFDGRAGSSPDSTAVIADQARPDVNQVTGFEGDHGFSFVVPERLKDNQNHMAYVYGIDIDDPAKGNRLLFGSPRKFKLTGSAPQFPPLELEKPLITGVEDGDLFVDNGTIYVIEYGKKRGFVSLKAFDDLGYSLKQIKRTNLNSIVEGEPISIGQQRHPRGSLVFDRGTIYFLGKDLRYAFPSADIFLSWGHRFERVVSANQFDLALPEGTLVQKKN